MPPGFGKPLRKDGKIGERGVLIAVKDSYNLTAVGISSKLQDIIWGEVALQKGKKLFLGAY